MIGAEGSTGGNNLIVGGSGDDTIYGSFAVVATKDWQLSQGGEGGQNLIVGGAGSDTIFASQETDGAEGGHGSVLVSDRTTLDQAALASILAEWTSADSYAVRVDRITGVQSGGINGPNHFESGATFINDSSIDQVFGDSKGQLNWFLYTLGDDELNRTKPGETLSDSQV